MKPLYKLESFFNLSLTQKKAELESNESTILINSPLSLNSKLSHAEMTTFKNSVNCFLR